MTHTITRRAAIGGVSALAAVITIPALAIASSALTLAGLIENWRGLQAAIEVEGKAIDALHGQLSETAPKLSPETQSGVFITAAGKHLKPTDGCWNLGDLDRHIRDGLYRGVNRQELENGETITFVDFPFSKGEITTFKSLRRMTVAHDKAVKRHFAEYDRRQEAWEASLDVADEALSEIVFWEPATLADLSAKAEFLKLSPAFEDFADPAQRAEIAQALMADIQRLAIA